MADTSRDPIDHPLLDDPIDHPLVDDPIDRDRFLDGIREVLPRISERSAGTEAAGSIPRTTIEDLDRCDLFVGLQPRRWGGLELDPATYFQGVVALASACGSAGWVGGVLGAHPWELACMHPDAQADVWGTNRRARIASSYAPTGRAERVADGYLVDGLWSFSSGVDHTEWAVLGALVAGEEKRGPRVFLVDRQAYEIDPDSWQVSGLSGTGSKDVRVTRAIVPEYRTHLFSELNDLSWTRPGWADNPGPLYRLPWMNIFSWAIASPALGAAAGMVDEYRRQSKSRIGGFRADRVADDTSLHQRLAEGIARVDTMTRTMISSWQELYAMAERRESLDELVAARGRYAGASTIAGALDAALIVFAQAGGGAMATANPLQRYIRDLLAMRNHPMAAIDRFATEQARWELGPPSKGTGIG